MNPIAIFLGLILLAASGVYVALPYRASASAKSPAGRGVPAPSNARPALEKQRQAILLAIRDLDFDYQANKVAEEDYQTLRTNLLTQAAQLIQRQERDNEDSLEALIQARHQARQTASSGKRNGAAGKQLCQHCQTPLVSGAKFCSKCGQPVGESTCSHCQQPLLPGDQFCPACGTALSS